MRSLFPGLCAGLAVLLTQTEPASAQFINNNRVPFQQPTFSYPALSPYLNLVRGNNTPAINYYLGTLPEFDRRNFQANVLQTLPALENAATGQRPVDINAIPTLPQTGHLAAFGAFGSYYNTPGIPQRPYYPLNPNQARMMPTPR